MKKDEDRIGLLIGMLQATPHVLWRTAGMIETVDSFIPPIPR